MGYVIRKKDDEFDLFSFTEKNPGGEAKRWEPGGDPLELGRLVGWLMASGADFHHPSGIRAATTLAIRTPDGEILAEPGDWILKVPFSRRESEDNLLGGPFADDYAAALRAVRASQGGRLLVRDQRRCDILARHGLVSRSPGGGWELTPAGRRALEAQEADRGVRYPPRDWIVEPDPGVPGGA